MQPYQQDFDCRYFATLDVLDRTGHLTLTWNPDDPADVAHARATVDRLASEGYSFFAVVGQETSDPIAAGAGRLIVDRLIPDRLIVDRLIPDRTAPTVRVESADVVDQPRRGRRVIATRPLRGG